MRQITTVVATVVLTFFPSAIFARTYVQDLFRLEIFEAGTYSATQTSRVGKPLTVKNPKLLKATTNISASQNVRFGVRYLLSGGNDGSFANVKMITRYPNSGIHDRSADTITRSSEYVVSVPIGRAAYRDFVFDSSSELLSGEWIFEFWSGEKKLGEQVFCVVVSDQLLPSCAMTSS